jgi:tetratricopeptide (TPR) repeat protein
MNERHGASNDCCRRRGGVNSLKENLHMKAVQRISQFLIFTSLLVGLNCAAPKKGVTISMSPELKHMDSNVSAAWMSYGMKKALWRTQTFFEKNPGDSTYVFTLAEEVDCRKSLADIWIDMRSKSGSHDKYLDELTSVVQAGFINEYVWKYLRQSSWTTPTELREEAFESLLRDNLVDHNCITLSTASSTEDTKYEEQQHKQQESLNKAIEEIQKRHFSKAEAILEEIANSKPANWNAFLESNDTIYCAFWDAEEEHRFMKRHSGQTIVPVFPSYSRVHYFLGFIKMETGNGEGALAELNKASLLQPDHTVILLEKGTVLSQLKRPQEAYDCFVSAEKPHHAASDFTMARALRGQGVTLIDLSRLDEAEQCFEKSLKHEPNNKVALNEIEYIRRLRSGESAPGADLKINRTKEK